MGVLSCCVRVGGIVCGFFLGATVAAGEGSAFEG